MGWAEDAAKRRDEEARRRRREDDTRRQREDRERRKRLDRQTKIRRQQDKKRKKRRKVQAEKAAKRKEVKAKKKKDLQMLMSHSVDDILSGKAEESMFGEAKFDPDEYALAGAGVNRASIFRSTWGHHATEVHDKMSTKGNSTESTAAPDNENKVSRGIGGSSQTAKFNPFRRSTAGGYNPSEIKPVTGPASAEERIKSAQKITGDRLKRGGF